tara:strand:- start:32123 stop:33181 length:1059 start_codon:yes stop_codon:yes gene_type:complete
MLTYNKRMKSEGIQQQKINNVLLSSAENNIHDILSLFQFHKMTISEVMQFIFVKCPETHKIKFLEALIKMPHPPLAEKHGNSVVEADRQNFLIALNNLAHLLYSKNMGDQSYQLLEPFKSCVVQNPHFGHNYACCLMLSGKKSEAIEMIRLAAENGYEETREMEFDPTFVTLAQDPKFKEIFTAWKKNGFIKNGYHVDIEGIKAHWPSQIPFPSILQEFGDWLRRQAPKSIGLFRMENPHPYFGQINTHLRPFFGEFLSVIDGTKIAIWKYSDQALAPFPVVQLCDTGEFELIAESIEEFFLKWGQGQSGVYDLTAKGDSKDALKRWTASKSLVKPHPSDHPDFEAWIYPKI